MKKFRKFLIAIIIVLSISVFVLAACDNVPESTVSDEPVAELSSWMSMIEDDTLLTELVIPGSHDSGTKGMNLFAETQDKTYLEQLERGFRYFDTRVMYTGGEFYMYHSVKGEMKYSQVLEDVKAFLDENPTETVILDFQWTEGGNDKGIFDMLEEKLGDKLINVEGKSALEFVKALTLGEARGKCLIFVGQNESNLDRPYQIARDKDSEEREGSALRSYYNASYIKTKIEGTNNALLETDGNGRFTTVKFDDDSVVYSLNVETVTDEDAYQDAMNEYLYKKEVYEKTIADINAQTSIIQQEDRTLELRLKQLDTEQNALATEMDAVKKVIKDNVESTFKTFSD